MTTSTHAFSDVPKRRDEPDDPAGLRGKMGVFSVVFMVLACSSPLTAAAGYVALTVAQGNGIGAPSMFLAVGASVLVFAIGYVEIIRRVARPGAFYTYITAGLGKRVGLGSAFLTTVTYFLAVVGLLAFGGTSLSSMVVRLHGPSIDWWVWSLAFLALAALLSYFNISVSARLLAAIVVVELLVVIGFDLAVALAGGPEGVSSNSFDIQSFSSGSVPLAFLFCLTLFLGWESPALYYEEVRNPQQTIVKATYIIVGVIAVLYALTTWMLITSYGSTNAVEAISADYSAAFGAAVAVFMGTVVRDVVDVVMLMGILASTLSANNMLSRYVYSLSVDGVLPSFLGKASARHGSPARATGLVATILLAALVVIVGTGATANDVLALSSGAATYGFLIMFMLATTAILFYFLRNRVLSRRRQVVVVASTSVSGLIFALMLVFTALNLNLIVGDQPVLTFCLQLTIYASLFIGILYASILFYARRDVFDRIGRNAPPA